MAALVLALLVLLGGAAHVAWRLHAYPGGRAYAFGDAYAGERRDLARARRGVRDLERAARRELTGARRKERAEKTGYQQRIRAAEQRLKDLRDPGRGEQIDAFGQLTLYQHTLRIGGDAVPLARLAIRVTRSRSKCHITVTRPAGRDRRLDFPGDAETEAGRFAMRVEGAVADENVFQDRRTSLISEAEHELARARADTAPQQSARDALDRLTARQAADPRLPAARAELDAARRRWARATGHGASV